MATGGGGGGGNSSSMVNVVWAEWDEIADEPTGTMYDFGQVRRSDAWEAILDAHLTADRLGWEGGNAYLTDSEGHLILLACDDDVPLDAPMPADDDDDDDHGGDWDGGEEDEDYGDFDADAGVEFWPVENIEDCPIPPCTDPNPTIPEWRPTAS